MANSISGVWFWPLYTNVSDTIFASSTNLVTVTSNSAVVAYVFAVSLAFITNL